MPRANRRRRDEAPLDLQRATGGAARREAHPDGEWFVRQVSGAGARTEYRCPGCQQAIAPGLAHVVAWPAEGVLGLAERRHWHAGCWTARHHRRPRGSWK
ncbi:MAG TPA: hypothetical protein VFJ97_07070 [Dermatophilaceae bacterium]|nr:hypothetical protein [Dermatophilaceae bacterium]